MKKYHCQINFEKHGLCLSTSLKAVRRPYLTHIEFNNITLLVKEKFIK